MSYRIEEYDEAGGVSAYRVVDHKGHVIARGLDFDGAAELVSVVECRDIEDADQYDRDCEA